MPVDTYLEIGGKRVFAGALDWPGWCRSGRNEDDALEAMVAYGSRYANVLRGSGPSFAPPKRSSTLKVVERLRGDATTDFGAPSIAPGADAPPLEGRELSRQRAILQACWTSFDRAAAAAAGVKLRTGPRGGGRDLGSIVGHVVGAEAGYARKLAAKPPNVEDATASDARDEIRAVVLDALDRAATEGLPAAGPRGGRLWSPRYFVRRAAWHVLDHAWEIEDRSAAG